MSWSAKRHNRRNWNLHHIPPQHPAATTPIKIRVGKNEHQAYHTLFQNAGSYEQCCEILYRDWWRAYEELKNANTRNADKTEA
jgi:hypothetical protein